MTEPNKELPKEVVEKINRHFKLVEGRGHATAGALVAQSHYAPIIEAKDKEIDKWETDWHETTEKIAGMYKTIAEKDKRIAELEATIDFNNIHNATAIYMKDATISKLMGLLKEEKFNDWGNLNSVTTLNLNVYNEWESYCKENGIDLGGE